MKVLKYVLLAVGGVVALVLLALAVVVAIFDPNRYKPEITAAVKDKTGRTLAIEGNLRLTVFPSVGVAVGKTSLSEPDSSRIFARIDEARMSLALLPLFSRKVVVDRVTLSGLTADLVKHKDGKTNFDNLLNAPGEAAAPPPRSKPAPKPAPQAGAVRLDIAGIEIRSSTVAWRDDSSGTRLKASLAEFKTGRIASGVPGKLSLAAKIEGTKPRVDLQIKLSSGYRLDFEKKKFALSGIDLRLSDESAGAKASGTSLKGDAEIDLAPQSIRFDLALDRLDIDRYLGTGKSKASASSAARGAPAAARGAPAAAAEEPIDLSPLKGLNLKGTLKIGALVASNVKLEKISVGAQASGGRVEISPLAASLYQGNLTGNASVNANTNRLALKAQLAGVAIGPLLKDALDNDMLEGKGNVALDVQTGGNTVGALRKALAGNAKLSLKDGALKGINLEDVIRKVKKQSAQSSQRTDLSELTASFVIKNGVAHNDDLSAKSPLLRLSGAGDVDVGGGTIDYLAKASVVASSTGQGGKDLADLNGITVPVKISGPLQDPQIRPDLKAAAGSAVKQQAQKAEEKLKERVQDRLKGLLGR